MLGELHLEVLGAAGEHPPHGPRLLIAQIREHGVGKARTRCVARRHLVAVMAGGGCGEALGQLLVWVSPPRRPSPPRPPPLNDGGGGRHAPAGPAPPPGGRPGPPWARGP